MSQPRGRPFQPGNTFGRGRPTGSRNKEKFPGQHLLHNYSEHLVRKCIALGMAGERSAMKICMDLISPARGDACIRMSLPVIKTAKDVDEAAEKVTQAIRRGKLTPTDGATWMNILESRARVIQLVKFEDRLKALEQHAATRAGSNT